MLRCLSKHCACETRWCGLQPALLLFLRGLARGALLFQQRGLARVVFFLQRGCELPLFARLALGGLGGFAQLARGGFRGVARVAFGLEARLLGATDLFLGLAPLAFFFTPAARFGDRLELGLPLLVFLVSRSGLLLEPVQQGLLRVVLTDEALFVAGALGDAPHAVLLLGLFNHDAAYRTSARRKQR